MHPALTRLARTWPWLPVLVGPGWPSLRARLRDGITAIATTGDEAARADHYERLLAVLLEHPAVAEALGSAPSDFHGDVPGRLLALVDDTAEASRLLDTVTGLLGHGANGQKIIDTALAAGVAAALQTGAEIFSGEAPFSERRSVLNGLVPPLVSWSDPLPWLADHLDDATWVADVWQIGAPSWPRLRLVVGGETDAELAALLSLGTGIASVMHDSPSAEPAGIPRWSWPLRLAFPGGPDALLAAARSRADHVTLVDTSGPWKRVSLLIVTDDDPAHASIEATAVIKLLGPPDIVPSRKARDLRIRHHAALAAVVHPGPSVQRWLEALLDGLSRDLPLDVALGDSAASCGAPPPVIAADPDHADGTRIRPVLPLEVLSQTEEARIGRALRGTGEAAPGSALAAMAAELRAAAHRERRRPSRFLRADVVERDGTTPAGRIEPDADLHLRVRIAADPDAPPGEEPFPADRLPPGRTHRLTVHAAELEPPAGREPRTASGEIDLPGAGDSGSAILRLRTRPTSEPMRIAVTVLHRFRFLQSGTLTVRAGTADPPVFQTDAVLRARTEDLDLTPPHDVAVLLDGDGDRATSLLLAAHAGRHVKVHEPDNLAGALDVLLDGLCVLTQESYRPGGYADLRFAELIIELARRGRALGKILFPRRAQRTSQAVQELWDARSVSVLSARPGAFLPLELVYGRPLATEPGRRLRLCPHAPSFADLPDCAACPEHEEPAVVCPFGFWGASKVIERHAPRGFGDPGYIVGASPDLDRSACALDPICAAASDRADHNDARAWITAVETSSLGEAGAARLATGWADLYDLIQETRAGHDRFGVIFLVPHTDVTRDGVGVLSLDEDDRRELTDGMEFLFADDGEPEPVVFVLGCATAGGATLFSDTSAMLLADGAPGVVATLVPIRGRDGVPAGVHLLKELRKAAARPGGAPLGEALLHARRRRLADGDISVLALVGFGDTDWHLRTSGHQPM
ncbi:hypothetical protein F8568_023570 [Actinomadura sp. LD22]|uniref:CHAT domain-containing protein n=1 Tax=Actinomadura physcomitrii TaxID=2650748 RepID=A0A6I4MC70_9ACTN|nr:hypothetical protein [Actinomadura physcomitrii]MWA03303.1 hypothetical protein [Actinomadura physcomitrii]